MPDSIGPSIPGARATKELFLRVQRLVDAAAQEGQSPDLLEVSLLLEVAIVDPQSRRGALMALAEFVTEALSGNVIDPRRWRPLEEHETQHRNPQLPVKRF